MLDGITKFGPELKRTNDLLLKRVSYRHTFFLGIVQGIGYAIGASIIAGLMVAFLIRFLQTVDKLPFLDQNIETDTIQQRLPYGELSE